LVAGRDEKAVLAASLSFGQFAPGGEDAVTVRNKRSNPGGGFSHAAGVMACSPMLLY